MTAFNEPYVKMTIESALSGAHKPQNIKFGINYVSQDGCFDDLSEFDNNVNVLYSITKHPRGWGVDRASADAFWSGEKYYLQIDAHMLFEDGWDVGLIKALKNIKNTGIKKPMISTFIPWWSMSDDGKILYFGNEKKPEKIDCCGVGKYIAGEITENWLEPQRSFDNAKSVCGDDFMEHQLIAGHFIFCESTWLEEVGHDPRFIMIGDETMISLRSWTRGYRIFSIGNHYLWHFNKQKFATRDWHIVAGAQDSSYNVNGFRFNLDKQRLRDYLLGKRFDIGGAPDRESLLAYQKVIDIDFADVYSKIDELKKQKGQNI